jgi:hypothetical protein
MKMALARGESFGETCRTLKLAWIRKPLFASFTAFKNQGIWQEICRFEKG